MIKSRNDIKEVVIGEKIYIRDDVIKAEFVRDFFQISVSSAYLKIQKVNEWAKKTKGIDRPFQGTTVLSWLYEYHGLIGNFIS